MIEKIKQIISENSEEKHFVEYGRGLFITHDAVDVISREIAYIFNDNISNSCQYEPEDDTTAANCKNCGNPKWTH